VDPKRHCAATRALPMPSSGSATPLADETGEYEVIGRAYTTNGGKDVHVRVLRVMLHTRWSADAWSQVRVEFKRALALRSEIRRPRIDSQLSAMDAAISTAPSKATESE
jgi:hypothetical protein